MAENVTWLLDQAGPDAKIVLWVHNGHVGMSDAEISQSMGDYLRKQFGNQMVVFGFLFYQGSFNACGTPTPPADHARPCRMPRAVRSSRVGATRLTPTT